VRTGQPHVTESFKLSPDPQLVAKVRDVVGLYMHPPHNAVVFSFDEKPQVQALQRAQPILPMDLGQPERQTHNYFRHGTLDLFAALNVATGEILTRCTPQHRAQDFVAFLRDIDASVETGVEIHVVLDNLSAHSAPPVAKWLAHPKRQRWHLHFTPTSSSWLNLVEGWFAQLTNRRLRNGSFNSVAALTEAIETWASHWNDDPKPFVWHTPANRIIAKVRRGRAALTHQTKSATHH